VTDAHEDRRAAFEVAAAIDDQTERLLEAAAVVSEELAEIGRVPIIVGGPLLPTGLRVSKRPATSTSRCLTTPYSTNISSCSGYRRRVESGQL
jgi:hypothetical protein